MIPNESFLDAMRRSGIHFFAGVPDSLLKHICACITDSVDSKHHVITANEGAAVALAAGHHLATGHVPLVYMQNSGLGNSANPLLSLADREVYSIPMLLMIGWRGRPGVKDEPQHVKQGRVQNNLLEAMEIPREVIGPDSDDFEQTIQNLVNKAQTESRPVALVVQKGTFEPWTPSGRETSTNNQQASAGLRQAPSDNPEVQSGLRQSSSDNLEVQSGLRQAPSDNPEVQSGLRQAPSGNPEAPAPVMTREEALGILVESLDDRDIVVSTTGVTSREIYELRAGGNMGHHRDFLTVGSMGHCSQIALGIALEKSDRSVYCVDGDGAVIMHMGAMAIIGSRGPGNYRHIVINNGAHDSVGGQPTAGFFIDIPAVAKACGYRESRRVTEQNGLVRQLDWLKGTEGPVLLEVLVRKGTRANLGRPSRTPVQNKRDLMKHLNQENRQDEGIY